MIVFESDWRRYKNAIVDTTTRNKSFLKIAKLYKEMGVKHYYFPLALLQPSLQGVDPFSDTLTLEQKAAILYECDNNPWYYLREICNDPGAGLTIEDKLFQANRGNIAAMWMTLACIDYLQIQPRQTGKSFGADTNSLWLLYFVYRNTSINLITKDETLRKSNIARYKKLRDAWPDYICRNTKKDDANQISLSCHDLNNRLYTHVSQASEKAANNLGRGMTSPFIQVDEGPFINQIETTISAAMGSTNAARDIAKKLNVPYCNVFTTTAGNPETRDGRFMFNMWKDAAVWTEMFYDCTDRDHLVALIKSNSRGRGVTVNLTLSHRQLGKTDQWLYEAIANARSEGRNIDRDYFNIWASNDDSSLLNYDLAKAIRSSNKDAIDTWISKEGYIWRWYEEYDPNERYVLSVDTSDALGRDDIACVLENVRTGHTAGAAAFNETNLTSFTKWLLSFLVKYTAVTLIPERKHNAQAIIDYLLLYLPEHNVDPFKRIFNSVVQERNENPLRYEEVMKYGINRDPRITTRYKNTFGFSTTKASRDILYGTLFMNVAKYAGKYTHDTKLIQQILSLQMKNGRLDHADGEHDDMVISWLIGHWFLNYAINLDVYGIDARKVLSNIADREEIEDPMQLYKDQQQELLSSKIDQLQERLSTCDNDVEAYRLESELRLLVDKVDTNVTSKAISFDAMIMEAREARKKRGNLHNSDGQRSGVKALLSRFGSRR